MHELKDFYNSSYGYLERLRRHDEQTFAPYLKLIQDMVPRGASILECGCGTGLSSYLLARLGYDVTGIDISELFLRDACQYEAELTGRRGGVGFSYCGRRQYGV